MNKIPLAYADVELQLAAAISIGDTSITLSSANDDDGNALPAGKYCFTVDNGSSNKEYLLGQLNGTDLTSVVSVSRQGVESSGAARAHRVGAPAILSDFAAIQRVADILRGQETADGDNPISYDAEPTLTDRKELATVAYVLDNITGGTVAFDSQVVTGVNAGETVAAGELVYFKTSDQEFYLADASVAVEVNNVQMGLALGAGTDGAAITGGVQISGSYTTTGLTAGATYYATDVAGVFGTSAGTTNRVIGVALSTTELLLVPVNPETPTSDEKAAMAGFLSAPSASNKFLTQNDNTDIVTFTADGTWTKDTGLVRTRVQVWGSGGSGAGHYESSSTGYAGGGGGGEYKEIWFEAADLGATETVTIGVGGASVKRAVAGFVDGNTGTATTFGSLISAAAGTAGTAADAATEGGDGGGSSKISGVGVVTAYTVSTHDGVIWGGGAGGTSKGGGSSADLSGGNAAYGGAGGGGVRGGDSSGAGGTSIGGGNGGAAGSTGGSNGTVGVQPGGGGGGAVGGNEANGNSGAGADGQVIVTEYYS